MIKTFVNTDALALDRAVNDAMAQHGRDLPVRTEMVVHDGRILHKAVLFFDGVKDARPQKNHPSSEKSTLQESPPHRVKIGAAWKNAKKADGTLHVRLDGAKEYQYVIAEEQQHAGDGVIRVENAQGAFLFLPNMKQKETSPDYTVYRVEES